MARLDRGEMRVLWQAHAAALAALAGDHRPWDAEALNVLCAHLPDDHPMRDAAARFAAVQARRCPPRHLLQDAGRALRHAVSLHLMPSDPGAERVDLNG